MVSIACCSPIDTFLVASTVHALWRGFVLVSLRGVFLPMVTEFGPTLTAKIGLPSVPSPSAKVLFLVFVLWLVLAFVLAVASSG